MNTVRLGEKGQITLPKSWRNHYHLNKGDLIEWIDLGHGAIKLITLKHARDLPPPVIKTGKKVSVEEMNRAIGDAVAEHFQSGDDA